MLCPTYIPFALHAKLSSMFCGVFLLFFISKTSGEDYALEEPLLDFVNAYCVSCHNPDKKKGKLDLESLLGAGVDQHFEVWDEVVWMLRERILMR